MAGDHGRCGVAVAIVLRAGRQNNQDFSAKITKICAKITKILNGILLVSAPSAALGALVGFGF